MQSSRLKNIIILILALVNIFLLASLFSRFSARRESREQTTSHLTELFTANGMTLSPDAVSFQPPPTGGILPRDTAQDRQMASLLLGDGLSYSDQGGGIWSYDSTDGAAVFRSGGSFDAAVHIGTDTEAEALCRSVCRRFHYEELAFQREDGRFTASAVRTFNNCPVYNCTISFSWDEGTLSVSGTFLPDTLTAAAEEDSLSAVSALSFFLSAQRELGAVATSITDIYSCYEVQTTSAASMTLVPAWCICTNIGLYYVNCYTGTVTHG